VLARPTLPVVVALDQRDRRPGARRQRGERTSRRATAHH
jgi:hypothetical protein